MCLRVERQEQLQVPIPGIGLRLYRPLEVVPLCAHVSHTITRAALRAVGGANARVGEGAARSPYGDVGAADAGAADAG